MQSSNSRGGGLQVESRVCKDDTLGSVVVITLGGALSEEELGVDLEELERHIPDDNWNVVLELGCSLPTVRATNHDKHPQLESLLVTIQRLSKRRRGVGGKSLRVVFCGNPKIIPSGTRLRFGIRQSPNAAIVDLVNAVKNPRQPREAIADGGEFE